MNYARKKADILNHVIRPEEQKMGGEKEKKVFSSHAKHVRMSVMYVFLSAGVLFFRPLEFSLLKFQLWNTEVHW